MQLTPRFKFGLALLTLVAVACAAVVVLQDDEPSVSPGDYGGPGGPAGGGNPSGLLRSDGSGRTTDDATSSVPTPGGTGLVPGARTPSGVDLSRPEVRRSELLRLIEKGSETIDWREVAKLLAIMEEPIPDELRTAMLNELLMFGRGRNQVMHAFSALRDPAITDDLFDILDDPDSSRGAERAALEALWRIPGADADAVALKLESRLANDTLKDRALLETIARRGGTEAARALVQYLQRSKKPGDVPSYILRSLDVSQNPEGAAVIADALRKERSPEVLTSLIDMVSKSGVHAYTEALIDLDSDRFDDAVRDKAITALALIGDHKGVEYLLEQASEQGDRGKKALDAMGRIQSAPAEAREKITKALEAAGSNPRPDEAKERYLLVLGTLREKKAIPTIVPYLYDPNARVREAAVRSLGRMRADARSHVDRLAKLFDGGEARTQAAVANALGSIGGQGALDAMTALLKTPKLSASLERTLKLGIQAAQDEIERGAASAAGGGEEEGDEDEDEDGK